MTQSTYELIKGDFANNGIDHIKRTNTDGQIWIIPIDEANSDYQAYLNKDKPAEQSTPNVAAE
jgi:hypothetical protein